MSGISLKKLHYLDETKADAEYKARFSSSLTRHFPIKIRQFGRRGEYEAFFCYTEETVLLLQEIYLAYAKALKEINTSSPVILRQFELISIVDEVKATNDIEAVHSTRRQIRDILDNRAEGKRLKSIVAKYEGILSHEAIAFQTPSDIRRFYDSFAHEELVAENPANRLDGQIFRRDSVDILSPSGRVIHRGLYPEEKQIGAMEAALAVLNDEKIAVLIRTGLFHYLFAYIHPFYDGNGRTARFIAAYMLARHLHPLIALRLSLSIKRRKKEYYRLFEEADSELMRGDLTPFVEGFLGFVLDSIRDATGLLCRKKAQLDRWYEKIERIAPKDDKMQALYKALLPAAILYGRGITMKELMDLLHWARPTIQRRLDMMPEEHLIKTGSKTIYYRLNLLLLK